MAEASNLKMSVPDTPSVRDTGSELDDVLARISQRLQAGEEVDWDAYCRDYPEHASQLQQILPAMQALAELGHLPDEGPAANDKTEPAPGALGDYRILREIGRGGMGVVYEAEQISLNRRVALKVLPFASVLDKRQLQRFKNEALAAAQLDHPHIVQVYGTGCERAVHFYAMQYIEGQTLAQAIGELRRVSSASSPERPTEDSPADADGRAETQTRDHGPRSKDTSPLAALSTQGSHRTPAYFRCVAEIGIQLAEALDHAHQQGIVHRDIKPSNLMLELSSPAGKGTGGEGLHAWVTDFGLAHIETGATLTMTGDLLGTLRYMSPEQAVGDRRLIDHRTDVYSLGVTLYELLTLRPAFPGDDRQELLRQIAFEDRKPARKLNPAIPGEVETIVLKCIAKNPAERYDTAQDLADDFGRFLNDEPIRAKRPNLMQRVAKWSRRHRTLVNSAAVILILAVIGLAVSYVLIARERNAALSNYETAKIQRQQAQANLQLAQRAVHALYTQVANEWVLYDEPDAGAKQDTLRKSLRFYEELALQLGVEPSVRHQKAKSYQQVGDIRRFLGEFDEAREAYRHAITTFSELAYEFPTIPRYRQNLANTYWRLGILEFVEFERQPEAETAFLRARGLFEKLVDESGHTSSAAFEVADDHYHGNAVWDWECGCFGHYDHSLVLILHWIGRVQNATGRLPESVQLYGHALRLQKKIRAEFPTKHRWFSQGVVHYLLGDVLEAMGRSQEAREHFDEAVKHLSDKIISNPHSTFSRLFFAKALSKIGRHQRAADEWETVLEMVPNNYDVLMDYSRFLATCPVAEVSDPGRAVQLAKKGINLAPPGRSYAYFWDTLQVAANKNLLLQGENGRDLILIAMAQWQLGHKDDARRKYNQAVEWIEKNKPTDKELRRLRAEAEQVLGIESQQPEGRGQKPEDSGQQSENSDSGAGGKAVAAPKPGQ